MTSYKRTKKKHDSYNQAAIAILRERYGISRDYIYKSVNGDRQGTFCDKIKKEYLELKAKQEQITQEFMNQNK